MHLLIPFAAPLGDGGPALRQALRLPQLAALLQTPPARDDGDDLSFSPPHERALALALGLGGADGGLPWAARALKADGRDPGDLAWGQLTPVHWHVGTDQISLIDPDELALYDTESRALLETVRELFEQEGFVVVYGAPTRWYAAHASLGDQRAASLDRVIGRNLDPWLPRGPQARLFRRLQNEVQMQLHQHPINEAREARGLLPVNSVWLSGCGVNQVGIDAPDLMVDERLRGPALAGDAAAWLAAWSALDAGPILALRERRDAGQPARLTLCGERSSATWTLTRPSWGQRLRARWRPIEPHAVLETL